MAVKCTDFLVVICLFISFIVLVHGLLNKTLQANGEIKGNNITSVDSLGEDVTANVTESGIDTWKSSVIGVSPGERNNNGGEDLPNVLQSEPGGTSNKTVDEKVHAETEFNRTDQSSNQSTEKEVEFKLPAHWENVCDLVGTETYQSEFTPETELQVIRCTVTPKHSHVINLHDLKKVSNHSTDVKLSLYIQCIEYASVSVSWPMKIWNLYKISVKECKTHEHYSEFNNPDLATIPDSLRVIEFINNMIMIPLSVFTDLLTRVDEFPKDYNCGHEETIERLTMVNQTEDFIIDMDEIPDILLAGEEYIKDTRKIDHVCNFKHLMVIDESHSTTQSTYKMEVLIQHSIFDQLRIFNQSHSYIKSIKGPILHWSIHFPNLDVFDLSWNNISGIYRFEVPITANPTKVTTINLQHNNISTISIDQLDRLRLMPRLFVDIRHNPIDCLCDEDFEDLLEYIHKEKYKAISEFANYSYLADLQCATPTNLKGITLRKLQISDVCVVETSTKYYTLPIIILIVSIVIIILLLILVLRYRQNIQIILFTRFDIILPCQSRVDDMDKKYDAFVSYSSNDEEWIEEFFENLEKRPLSNTSHSFKFCMHHRDFIPGKTIFDNVINSVESSRHTIILLSKHYLGSEFCLYEFQEAFRQSVMEQKRHLIIVMMEDIPDEDLPRDLRRCIKTFTYIRKDDSLFTQRLLFALTIKPKSKVVMSPEKDFNSDLSTPSVKQKSKSTLSKITSKISVGRPTSSSSITQIDSKQNHNNNSNHTMVQLTDIVKMASNNLEKSGVTNMAFVNETSQNNLNDLGKTVKIQNGSATQPEVYRNLSVDDVNEDSEKTSEVVIKASKPINRLDSFSKTIMESKIIDNNVCYDRSLSCLSQDTGYSSDRGSYFDRNLQDICETP